jgi:hypothetical protein
MTDLKELGKIDEIGREKKQQRKISNFFTYFSPVSPIMMYLNK